MFSRYSRFVQWTLLASCALPFVVALCSPVDDVRGWTAERKQIMLVFLGVVSAAMAFVVRGLVRSGLDHVEQFSAEQAIELDKWPAEQRLKAVAVAAALGLFLELVLIRWQSSLFEFFAFYKNLSLLACFAGLGIGYALARDRHIPLVAVLPLLVFQMEVLCFLRYMLDDAQRSALTHLPVWEQLYMGSATAQSAADFVAAYTFLSIAFMLTALTMIPVGQLGGRLMEGQLPLRAYGANLLGSIAGAALTFAVAWMWTPPLVWFVIVGGGLLYFQRHELRTVQVAAVSMLLLVLVLSVAVPRGWEQIYTPYQLVERGPGENGLTMIKAAGTYYQRALDLSADRIRGTSQPHLRQAAAYYELPYTIHGTPGSVVVVGAGTGNDVAAALRKGAAHVEAVEIDPVIAGIGASFHPEKPYDNPNVHLVINDARTFLRKSTDQYDMIVYGLLDSHSLLSHGSSVRIDSFVYTVEALREARARLKPGGMLSLSFALLSPELGRKIYLMLQEAFDGQAPRCVRTHYDDGVLFLQTEGKPPELPPALLAAGGFDDVTARYASPDLHADLSTDDWPFFYMTRRIYPVSYLGMAVVLLVLSGLLVKAFFPVKPVRAAGVFFLLGAGFMLIETKGITELGLTFGNTWHVIGVVIIGILLFAFLGNALVARLDIRSPYIAYVLLLASIAAGLALSAMGGFGSGWAGRIGATVQLTGPLFFSGIVFSTLLARTDDVPRSLAANLFGALCGGLLEYNSMYFGFQFLYGLALVIYGLALLLTWKGSTATPAPAAPAPEAATAGSA